MNQRENNQIRMFDVVNAVLNKYRSIVEKIEALAGVVEKFRVSLDVVVQRNREFENVTKGVTVAKNSAGRLLADLTYRIANALYVYGVEAGDEKLKAACRLKKYQLNKMRMNELKDTGVLISELAGEHAEKIIPAGISAEDIEAHRASLDAFSLQLDDHYQKHAESKAAREMLTDAFDATNLILKEELDVMVETVEESEKEFYEEYQAARVIKDLGGGHTTKQEATAPDTAGSAGPAEERLAA